MRHGAERRGPARDDRASAAGAGSCAAVRPAGHARIAQRHWRAAIGPVGSRCRRATRSDRAWSRPTARSRPTTATPSPTSRASARSVAERAAPAPSLSRSLVEAVGNPCRSRSDTRARAGLFRCTAAGRAPLLSAAAPQGRSGGGSGSYGGRPEYVGARLFLIGSWRARRSRGGRRLGKRHGRFGQRSERTIRRRCRGRIARPRYDLPARRLPFRGTQFGGETNSIAVGRSDASMSISR